MEISQVFIIGESDVPKYNFALTEKVQMDLLSQLFERQYLWNELINHIAVNFQSKKCIKKNLVNSLFKSLG